MDQVCAKHEHLFLSRTTDHFSKNTGGTFRKSTLCPRSCPRAGEGFCSMLAYHLGCFEIYAAYPPANQASALALRFRLKRLSLTTFMTMVPLPTSQCVQKTQQYCSNIARKEKSDLEGIRSCTTHSGHWHLAPLRCTPPKGHFVAHYHEAVCFMYPLTFTEGGGSYLKSKGRASDLWKVATWYAHNGSLQALQNYHLARDIIMNGSKRSFTIRVRGQSFMSGVDGT